MDSETLNIGSKSYVIDPTYNTLGYLTDLSYGGAALSYSPNALGQPTRVMAGTAAYASAVTFHPNVLVHRFNYGNGVEFSQTLDNMQRPMDLLNAKAGHNKTSHSYRYDGNHNVSDIFDFIDRSKDIKLTYDDVDRLVTASGSWGNGSFSYDSTGNLLTKHLGTQQLVYGYDPLTNRLSTVTGNYNFGYDDRGNVTSNGHRSFVFNRANQLTSSGAVSYVYDGHNRRVKKNTATASYSVYNKSGQLLLTDGPQGITRYIYLGSKLIARSGNVAATEDKPGYTGHLEDDDLSLTYMQQRYYDSVLGRFYSNDPVGFTASNPMMFNRYAYGNNNPYKFTDPDGREPLSDVFSQAFGYSNATEANLQAPSDIGAAANQIAQDASVGLQVVSDVTGAAGIGAIALGPEMAPVSAGLLTVSGATGVAAAALSNDPAKNVAIEVATNVGPGKLLGASAEIIKGAAKIENGSGAQMAIDVGKEVSAKHYGDELKQDIKKD